MTKKGIKIILIIILMIMSIQLCSFQVYAADTIDEVMQGADKFVTQGAKTDIDQKALEDTSDLLYNILLGIAMVVAVIVGLIIGIRFMVSGVDEKAKVKEELMPYVIGCFIVFGAFGIWKIIVSILSSW